MNMTVTRQIRIAIKTSAAYNVQTVETLSRGGGVTRWASLSSSPLRHKTSSPQIRLSLLRDMKYSLAERICGCPRENRKHQNNTIMRCSASVVASLAPNGPEGHNERPEGDNASTVKIRHRGYFAVQYGVLHFRYFVFRTATPHLPCSSAPKGCLAKIVWATCLPAFSMARMRSSICELPS